jgi:hypothetical protein
VSRSVASSREGEGIMFRHTDRNDGIDVVLRANRARMLRLLWTAFAACVVSSLAHYVSKA